MTRNTTAHVLDPAVHWTLGGRRMTEQDVYLQLASTRRLTRVLAVVVAVLVALQIVAWVRPAKKIVLSDGESTLTIDPALIDLRHNGYEMRVRADELSLWDPTETIRTGIMAGSFNARDGETHGRLAVSSDSAILSLDRGTDSQIHLFAAADVAFVRTDCRRNEITMYNTSRGSALFGGKRKTFELGDNRDEVVLGKEPLPAR
jgi:hypothetical protein